MLKIGKTAGYPYTAVVFPVGMVCNIALLIITTIILSYTSE